MVDVTWGVLAPKVAVTMLLWSHCGRWLFNLRDDKPGIWAPGHWSLCGGQVELGETCTEAAVREMQEELGLTIPATELVVIGVVQEPTKPSVLSLRTVPTKAGGIGRCVEGRRLDWLHIEAIEVGALAGSPIVSAHVQAVAVAYRKVRQWLL